MLKLSRSLIVVVLCTFIVFVASDRPTVTKDIDWSNAVQRTAYVLIHENPAGMWAQNADTNANLLGIRVVIRSIRQTGSKRDIVVICSHNLPDSDRQVLEGEGAIIKQVDDVGAVPDCERSFKRIHLWNLLDYDRVLFLDSDTLVNLNMDELFLCGHFCTVLMSWMYYTDSVMVVKPDATIHERLLDEYHKLHLEENVSSLDSSCLSERYKFFFLQFFNMEGAPLFKPENGQSESPTNRLDLAYSVNTIFYYEHFSWHLVRNREYANLTIPAVTLSFPADNLKPWLWIPAIYFDIHWVWQTWRRMLIPEESFSFFIVSRIIMLFGIYFGGTSLLNKVYYNWKVSSQTQQRVLRLICKISSYLNPNILGFLCGVVCTGIAMLSTNQFMGHLIPPRYVIPFAITYHNLFLFLIFRALAHSCGLMLPSSALCTPQPAIQTGHSDQKGAAAGDQDHDKDSGVLPKLGGNNKNGSASAATNSKALAEVWPDSLECLSWSFIWEWATFLMLQNKAHFHFGVKIVWMFMFMFVLLAMQTNPFRYFFKVYIPIARASTLSSSSSS